LKRTAIPKEIVMRGAREGRDEAKEREGGIKRGGGKRRKKKRKKCGVWRRKNWIRKRTRRRI